MTDAELTVEVLKIVVPTLAILFGVGTYIDRRRRELQWKKVEFLFEQSKYMEEDQDIWEAIQILENRHSTITVDDVFEPSSQFPDNVKDVYQHKFDKFLNLLDRVAFAVLETKALTLKEAVHFGWYLRRIGRNKHLRDYCRFGFQEVLTLQQKVTDYMATTGTTYSLELEEMDSQDGVKARKRSRTVSRKRKSKNVKSQHQPKPQRPPSKKSGRRN